MDLQKELLPAVSDEDDVDEGDDEKPIIVVLKKGDVSREEFEKIKQNKEEDNGKNIS